MILKGGVEHAALVGVHGLKGTGAAGCLYLACDLAGKACQGLLALFPVSLGVDGNAGVALLLAVAVYRKAGKVLHGVQGLAPVAYQHAHGGLIDIQADALILSLGKYGALNVHVAQQSLEELCGRHALSGFLGKALGRLLGLPAVAALTLALAAAVTALSALTAGTFFAGFLSLTLGAFLSGFGCIIGAFGAFGALAAVTTVTAVTLFAALATLAALVFGIEVLGEHHILRLSLGKANYGGLCADAKYALAFLLDNVYFNFVDGYFKLLKAVENSLIYGAACCVYCPCHYFSAPSC